MKQKRCNICSEIKDITDFYAYKNSADGLQSKCKSCDNEIRAKNQKKTRKKYKELIEKKLNK